MSATLKWKPVRPEGKSLGDAAKFLFRENYSLNDGNVTLSSGDVLWMRGALAATNDAELKKDLSTLIEAIGKYGAVELWQEY